MAERHLEQTSGTIDATMHDKDSILAALADMQATVHAHYDAMSPEELLAATGTAWSASQNIDHLIKTSQGIAHALTLPEEALNKRFGTAQAPSCTYAELQARYSAVVHLANEKQPDPRFDPAPPQPTAPAAATKQALLGAWNTSTEALIGAVQRWDEAALDRSVLPHPLLGNLTIREMLFFTVYHAARHISEGGD